MSLVAAYDSDSDDEITGSPTKAPDANAAEEVDFDQIAPVIEDNGKVSLEGGETFDIEDDDEWQGMSASSSRTKQNNETGEKSAQLFSFLPQPKNKKEEIVEEDDDEFIRKKPIPAEDEVKPEKRRNKLLNLTKPTKTKRKTVQISVPTLEEIGADSDSDEEKPKKPVSTGNKKSSTLFAALPKPRHSVTVGDNKNRMFTKQTNRSLLPHTLKTQKTDPKKNESAAIKAKPTMKPVESDEEGDDDDIETSGNFFALESDNKNEATSPNTETSALEVLKPKDLKELTTEKPVTIKTESENLSDKNVTHVKNTATLQPNKNVKDNSFFANLFKPSSSTESKKIPPQTLGSKAPVVKTDNAIISHNSSIKSQSGGVTAPYSSVTEPYGNSSSFGKVTEPYSSVTAPYSSVTEPYSSVTEPYGNVNDRHSNVTAPYNDSTQSYSNVNSYNTDASQTEGFFNFAYKQNADNQSLEGDNAQEKIDLYNQPNQDLPLDAKAIQALQGRKRNREQMNIIDINAADIQANSDEHLKNLTIQSGYSSKKSKNDEPNRRTKNKHQITYLAFQAKEREFELQQAWAESRSTKQQTQSRYGF